MTIEQHRLVVQTERKPSYELDDLLSLCDPNAEMSAQDSAWINEAPIGSEIEVMKMKPDKYCFPALFGYYDDGHVSVVFPDLPGCVSCGKSFDEAIRMAREALGGHIACMEDDGYEIPNPSTVPGLYPEKHQAVVMVDVLMPFYRESEFKAVTP